MSPPSSSGDVSSAGQETIQTQVRAITLASLALVLRADEGEQLAGSACQHLHAGTL
jgi:hypothetical protein